MKEHVGHVSNHPSFRFKGNRIDFRTRSRLLKLDAVLVIQILWKLHFKKLSIDKDLL